MQIRTSGFTLIEILIVILLISIIIGVAMVIPNTDHSQTIVKEESSKLAFLFNKASEKALLSGNEVGFSLQDDQYHWSTWDRSDEKWLSLSGRGWTSYALPENITVIVNKDGQEDDLLKETATGPIVVFYADGTMTPVNLVFSVKGKNTWSQTLKSDGVTSFAE